MKSKLLIIEDNNEDIEIAVSSLKEAGEDFDYTTAGSLSEALWELECSPKYSFEKIFIDLGLKDVKNRTKEVLRVLTGYVGGLENIIVVCNDVADCKEAQRAGASYVNKNDLDSRTALSQVVSNLEESRHRSVQRHRDLADLEIKIVKIESQVEHNREEIKLLLNNFRSQGDNAIKEIDRLEVKLELIEDEMFQLKDQFDNLSQQLNHQNAFKLKSFELRWQVVLLFIGALATALLPKLIEGFIKQKWKWNKVLI